MGMSQKLGLSAEDPCGCQQFRDQGSVMVNKPGKKRAAHISEQIKEKKKGRYRKGLLARILGLSWWNKTEKDN